MNGATVAALVTSSAALVGAVVAIAKWNDEKHARDRAIEAKAAEWDRASRKNIAEWQVQLLHELFSRRLSAYPSVFRTLGAAVYVEGSEDEVASRAELAKTADELFDHLYGEAGVLMSPDARDALQGARVACKGILSGDASRDDLINFFWEARKELRLDVQVLNLSFDKIVRDLSRARESKSPRQRGAAPSPRRTGDGPRGHAGTPTTES